jgi:hypothetical protein
MSLERHAEPLTGPTPSLPQAHNAKKPETPITAKMSATQAGPPPAA